MNPKELTKRSLRVDRTEIFDEWMRGLRNKVAVRAISMRITRISVGNFGDAKSVGGGVSEFRVHTGPGYRIYFTIKGTEVVLLLVGGDKGSQDRDIEKAKQLAQQIREQQDDRQDQD